MSIIDDNESNSEKCRIALLFSVKYNYPDILSVLSNRGVDINICSGATSALYCACEEDRANLLTCC